ncbi:MAG: hypothetical protein Q8M22_01720 [Actinomycetota bacterium]|nr:hypothetical protein [Actinomycetota bacterium]
MTTLKKWQDEYFTQLKRVEEPMVRFVGERAETMARFVPGRPPFMANMPTMTALIDNQLKFRKRVVDEQTMFVRKMLKAMDPMVTKLDTVPKPAAHTAPKSAVRTAPRRMTRAA